MSGRRLEVTNERRKFDDLVKNASPNDGIPGQLGGCLAFGPFLLDPENGRLLENGRVVPLAPKPFETLLYLARRPGRVISKAELIDRLWAGTFVTDDVLVQCVVDIRRALHDHAKTPLYVQTAPRRGYEFVAQVRVAERSANGIPGASPGADPTDDGASTPAESKTPRSALRRWVWAGLGILVLLALAVLTKSWGRAPEAPLRREPGSMVVMPVPVEEAVPQSGWLRHGLAEMLRSQLGQDPGVHLVARHRVAALLAQAGYDEERAPTPEGAVQLARRLQADRLVTGSFVRVEDRFLLSAQIVEVASGRTESAASVRGRHPVDLIDAVAELCAKLLHGARPPSQPGAEPRRPVRVATRSLDAYQRYVEAVSLFARGGQHEVEDAERRLDEALRLDPSFAQAYVKKAEVQQWRRQWGYGDPDPVPAVRAAARLARELPERERLLVDSFEALIVRGQPATALKDWNTLLQLYPAYAEELGVPALVAESLIRQGRWDDLIRLGEEHVGSPSLPDAERARLSSHLAQAFRRKGEFERALEHARRAVLLWPVREGPRFLRERSALGRLSLEAGRREEAIAEFEAVAAAKEADAPILTDAAWGLYMAGVSERASSLVARALTMDASYGNAFHLRGWLQLAREEYGPAAESLREGFERTPKSFGNPHQGIVSGDLAALYYSAVALSKLGQRAAAAAVLQRLIRHCQRLLQSMDKDETAASGWQAANFIARAEARLGQSSSGPPRLQGGDDMTFFVQSARLHAVEGKHEQALRELAQGLALGHGELRHIADDPDFESLRREPEFKRLVLAPVEGEH